jgi:hypothetical protein
MEKPASSRFHRIAHNGPRRRVGPTIDAQDGLPGLCAHCFESPVGRTSRICRMWRSSDLIEQDPLVSVQIAGRAWAEVVSQRFLRLVHKRIVRSRLSLKG